MNEWQVLKELQNKLRLREWENDASNEIVFASVIITPGIPPEALIDISQPAALLNVGAGRYDPENQELPDLIEQDFDITWTQVVPNDATGEAALVGGHRTAGQGSSKGRGLLEIHEEGTAAIGKILSDVGLKHQNIFKSGVAAEYFEKFGYVVWRRVSFSALVSRDRFYHPVTKFTAVDAAGAGDADLAWTNPPDRYDYIRNIVRRAAGGTPPATATDGTGVTLGSDKATSVTDSPSAGPFAYSVFAAYNETGGTTNERFSASDTATVTVT